jgi:hypothetical protein
MARAEICPSTIGHITLGTKQTGAPSAGNLHAGFDVAGTGNQLTVWLLRHSQRKRRETDRPNLPSLAPVLDLTNSPPRGGTAGQVTQNVFRELRVNSWKALCSPIDNEKPPVRDADYKSTWNASEFSVDTSAQGRFSN